MDNSTYNEGGVPDAPAPAEVEHILRTYARTFEEFADAFGGRNSVHVCVDRLARSIAASGSAPTATLYVTVSMLRRYMRTSSPSGSSPTAGPAAARSVSPAFNNHAAAALSLADPIASTDAGPAAVSALRLHLLSAILPVARPTAAEKGKGRAPPGDGPPTRTLRKRQRVAPRVVEAIDISSDEEDDAPNTNKIASSSMQGALPNVDSLLEPRWYGMLLSPSIL
ncbi:hypothetical protein GGH94_004076 [Coemansia aciculifera]|uniref:Uncharacterized protein n=1 Tax=Coemansia aciculifera TaxID=417176 RepID=A0A9W8M5K9_9FUNG|nr:hypothetical protein GGH94_004076 [Coemansia aciculifera]